MDVGSKSSRYGLFKLYIAMNESKSQYKTTLINQFLTSPPQNEDFFNLCTFLHTGFHFVTTKKKKTTSERVRSHNRVSMKPFLAELCVMET
jgi:hypothetical protein